MYTSTYQNWTAKTLECGFTNEQACGLAILYAWSLSSPKGEVKTDRESDYWNFVTKTEFNEISQNSFTFEDFSNFYHVLQIAGELLKVELPSSRKNADGEATSLLDLNWMNSEDDSDEISENLLLRHRFDLLWCQQAGESLREEIRTPQHAYVFADFLTHGFLKLDPEGYSRILHKLLKNSSPLVSTFTSSHLVINNDGLKGYLPFQIALLGFIGNLDPELGEQLWNIQRALFYKQPSGELINSDKQDLPLDSFLEFSSKVVNELIDKQHSSYFLMGKLIASEYLYRSSDYEPFDQFCSLMQTRYGFGFDIESTEKPLNLLINSAAFYTVCCLKIRNLTNRISELPSLRMREDTGLLWSNDHGHDLSLKEEAIQCFDVMLSWRFGASWALFLETESGFVQRAYVGDSSEYEEIDNLFGLICSAYRPVRTIITFWTHRKVSHEDDNLIEEVVLINLDRNGTFGIDVFKGGADIQRGPYISDHMGFLTDKQLCEAYFPITQKAFMATPVPDMIREAQDKLLEIFPSTTAWHFVDRLEKIWETSESITYADTENIVHKKNLSLMWIFIDYFDTQLISNEVPHKSSKVLFEYNCTARTRRVIMFRLFESGMGNGRCVYDSGILEKQHEPVPDAGNVGYKAWEIASTLNVSRRDA